MWNRVEADKFTSAFIIHPCEPIISLQKEQRSLRTYNLGEKL